MTQAFQPVQGPGTAWKDRITLRAGFGSAWGFMGVFMGMRGEGWKGWEGSGPRYFSGGVKTLSVPMEAAVTAAARGFVPWVIS